MTDAVCAACSHAVLEGLNLCFDCDLGNGSPPAPARVVRRLRWNAHPREPARLARIVEALCPKAEPGDISWLADGKGNELLADVTPEQDGRLTALMTAAVPEIAVLADATAASTGVRIDKSGAVREKLAAAVVVGGLAVAFAVPVVPFAAGLTAALLISRMPRGVSRRVTVEKREVEALLGTFGEEALVALRTTRMTLAPAPALAEAFRTCVAPAAAIATQLRTAGAHIEHAEIGSADAELGRLVRAISRLAVLLSKPPAGAVQPYRYEAAVNRLNDLGGKIAALKPLASRVRVAPREAAPSLKTSLETLTRAAG
jgi:hypothetical protein